MHEQAVLGNGGIGMTDLNWPRLEALMLTPSVFLDDLAPP